MVKDTAPSGHARQSPAMANGSPPGRPPTDRLASLPVRLVEAGGRDQAQLAGLPVLRKRTEFADRLHARVGGGVVPDAGCDPGLGHHAVGTEHGFPAARAAGADDRGRVVRPGFGPPVGFGRLDAEDVPQDLALDGGVVDAHARSPGVICGKAAWQRVWPLRSDRRA